MSTASPPEHQYKIRFTGRVFPECLELSFSTSVVAGLHIGPDVSATLDGLEATFRFKIEQGQVEVVCRANRNCATDLAPLLTSAYEIVRSAVDLMAFSTGMGITLIFEKIHHPDGEVEDVRITDPGLPPLCKSYRTNMVNPDESLDDTLLILLQDRHIMRAMNDLTATMETPGGIRASCFRAVEAIRQAISRIGKPPKRYGLLRDALNISDDYIEIVMEESKGPRHGDYFRPPSIP